MRFVRPMVVLAASAVSIAAHAVPVSYSFSGRIDYLSYGLDMPSPFGGARPFNETATGSFTIDTDYLNDASTDPLRMFLQPTSSEFASFGISVSNFAPLSSFGSVGNCAQPYSYVAVSDNNPNVGFPQPQPGQVADQWQVSIRCTEQIAPGVEVMRNLYIELNDSNPVLNPDLINGLDPLQLFDLALATTSYVSFGYLLTDANCTTCLYGAVEGWNLGVDLASLTRVPTNVPEPATATLLMLGLTGCLLGRRRRSQLSRS